MKDRHAHCSTCGAKFPGNLPWPRTCSACGEISYLNPLPVAVLLLPVDNGLLCIERDIAPGKGQRALPGGFIDVGESWQAAAARELREETGISIDASDVRLYDARSAPDGTLLVFGIASRRTAGELPPFKPTNETSARVVIHAPETLAFPIHTRVVQRYFEEHEGNDRGRA